MTNYNRFIFSNFKQLTKVCFNGAKSTIWVFIVWRMSPSWDPNYSMHGRRRKCLFSLHFVLLEARTKKPWGSDIKKSGINRCVIVFLARINIVPSETNSAFLDEGSLIADRRQIQKVFGSSTRALIPFIVVWTDQSNWYNRNNNNIFDIFLLKDFISFETDSI